VKFFNGIRLIQKIYQSKNLRKNFENILNLKKITVYGAVSSQWIYVIIQQLLDVESTKTSSHRQKNLQKFRKFSLESIFPLFPPLILTLLRSVIKIFMSSFLFILPYIHFYTIDQSTIVFRAGEQGRYWYAVLGGQLEVRYHAAADSDTKVSLSTFFSFISVMISNKMKNLFPIFLWEANFLKIQKRSFFWFLLF